MLVHLTAIVKPQELVVRAAQYHMILSGPEDIYLIHMILSGPEDIYI